MAAARELSVSSGEDASVIAERVTELVERRKWELCKDGKGLERVFKFKTFQATWSFMNSVAEECKKQKHHPEWSNVYNKTHIRWTTHNPEGLSRKDTIMADFCDRAAEDFNELDVPASERAQVRGVDGKVQAGDCCTPKKS